jgi:hypothetical protein
VDLHTAAAVVAAAAVDIVAQVEKLNNQALQNVGGDAGGVQVEGEKEEQRNSDAPVVAVGLYNRQLGRRHRHPLVAWEASLRKAKGQLLPPMSR